MRHIKEFSNILKAVLPFPMTFGTQLSTMPVRHRLLRVWLSAAADLQPPREWTVTLGVCATIGKGERNDEVCDAVKRNKGIYLCAIGGAGALAAKAVTDCRVIAFEDLGCESVKQLTFNRFPLTVGIDCGGGNIFKHRD